MIYGIVLIILGLLAAPSLFVGKNPNAKELLEKFVPYQGWTGLVVCFWGIWGIISCILSLGMFASGVTGIVIWVMWLLVSVVEVLLGFLLGYSLIAKYVLSKNETTKQKGEEMLAKLQPLSTKIGVAGIVVGALYTILFFVL